MSNLNPRPEHLFHRAPESAEYFENNKVFESARELQEKLSEMRFETFNEAIKEGAKHTGELDKMAKDEGLINEIATLIGPDLIVPSAEYDRATGGVIINVRPAAEIGDKIVDASGEFYGFSAYAARVYTAADEYIPTIAVQVRLRHFDAPSFGGFLYAYGPVNSTAINFVDDTLKRTLSDGLI